MAPPRCPCCGGDRFRQQRVLWQELIDEWSLSSTEADYIDRQQGWTCERCGCSLRSMALANAIMACFGFSGRFSWFVRRHRRLRVLEINEAGQLTQFLARLPRHDLVRHPEVDMRALPSPDATYDLVVHSDTLEHVPDPVLGLAETRRVLRPGGFTCFTVPLVVARLTASRAGRQPAYHGTPHNEAFPVHTEYGSDAWTQVVRAGFDEVRIVALEYPAGLALVGRKGRQPGRVKKGKGEGA